MPEEASNEDVEDLPRLQRRRSFGIKAIALILVVFGGFVVVEGFVSLGLTGWDLIRNPGGDLPSRVHAAHDTLLGWRNAPGYTEEEQYGPDGDLRINQQSFREAAAVDSLVPQGRKRILCVGDSFTFGIGVGNAETWCSRLASLDPQIESVNLGHAGYGIDQAALFYLRDGQKIDHDQVILAFIPDDVRRLQLDEFVGMPKPYFVPAGGEVALRNVPVRERSLWSRLVRRHASAVARLRIAEAAQRLLQRFGISGPTNIAQTRDTALEVALRVFEMVRDSAEDRGRSAVFVLLEQWEDSSVQFDEMARMFSNESIVRDLYFLDIRTPFRDVPADTLAAFFLPAWGGHYSARGHQRVAELIQARLMGTPELCGLPEPAIGAIRP